MENRTDKNSYTLIFAVIMVFVVGAVLAGMFSFTKPLITVNEEIEKQQNILYALGINENDESSANFVSTDKADGLFKQYVSKQIVIEGDKVTENDKAYLIDVKKEQTRAKDGETRRLPLFIGKNKEGKTLYLSLIHI